MKVPKYDFSVLSTKFFLAKDKLNKFPSCVFCRWMFVVAKFGFNCRSAGRSEAYISQARAASNPARNFQRKK